MGKATTSHPIIHAKIQRALEAGLTKEEVIHLYHGEGYSMEKTISAIEQLRDLHFTPRSFKVLCEALEIPPKDGDTVARNAALTQSRSTFNATLESLETAGMGRSWMAKNYPLLSTNELVNTIQKQGITMYKELLRRVLLHHGITLRSREETNSLRYKRIRDTNKERYGVDNPMQVEGVGENMKIALVRNLLIKEGASGDELEGLSLDELLKISHGRFFGEVNRAPRRFSVGRNSTSELLLMERFDSLGMKKNIDYLVNNRSVIYPYEIDFYLPLLALGVEISPPWTHHHDGVRNPRIDPLYHHRKFSMAREAGVDLIQWFSEDWDGLWNLIISKVTLGPHSTPPGDQPFSIKVSANEVKSLELERAGYTLAEHSAPEKRWALRTGEECVEDDRGRFPSLRCWLSHLSSPLSPPGASLRAP